ncbi:MAG: cobalamin biosynthesis protein [Hydrogenophaga sp.]|nr:cobalamin biosynthesis protein [Hydrogenophaga sp.]
MAGFPVGLPWTVWAAAIVVALLVDLCWGEPPARWHPVVGMGRYLSFMGRRIAPLADAPAAQGARSFVPGVLAWCLGAACVVVLATALAGAMATWSWWLQALALGLLLKPLLAWRMLRDEVRAVEAALGESLAAGRERLAMLVSRDVSALDAALVRASAIESLA